MTTIPTRIDELPWSTIARSMHSQGYAEISGVLTPTECAQLITAYDYPTHYRKTITMERYRFGRGEYKYFAYPLPPLIEQIQSRMYEYLAPIANQWMGDLRLDRRFPGHLDELRALCEANQQTKPTVLILQYSIGGYNTLHQDLYGAVFFPLQLVLFLNEPNEDYTGGEFVMLEQRPRAQSRAIVLQPKKGDMLVFTTNFRSVAGSRGFYRASMKHGVSAVRSGQRHTLGIIFHDAL